jgi:DNA-binding LacI/PurR family transcriptional regulator
MSSNVTLKDVAERAGVSYQTVSKVLQKQLRVTPQTQARIDAAVRELGYRPNAAARSLRTRNSRLIGYSWHPNILMEISPVLEAFLNSIVDAAARYDYRIMLFPYDQGEEWLSAYQELVLSNNVDAFILTELGFSDSRIPLLQQMGTPFAAFGHCETDDPFSYVDVDNCVGGRLATEHLIEQGHRRIASLAWPADSRVGEERLEGYLAALDAAGIAVNNDYIVRGLGTFEAGYAAAARLLDELDTPPTAFMTMVDTMAIGAMRAAADRGLRIGADVGVVGFDDSPFAHYVEPKLSSIRQPIHEIGTTIIDLIMTMTANHQATEPQHLLLDPTLVVRDSSLRAAAEARPT